MTEEPQTLILVGFMGAGKTTVGREIARQHQSQFLDLDLAIEQKAGITIPEIFKSKGEAHFRQLEEAVVKESVTFPGVVATGGGVVENEKNRQTLKDSDAVVIYLHGNLEGTIGRLLADGQRPLLQKESTISFFKRWQKRDPLYQEVADYVVETVGKTPARIAAEIVALFSGQADDLTLTTLRSQIDALDRQIFDTIAERIGVVRAVAAYKQKVNLAVRQPERMVSMKANLKADYRQNDNITDDLIDALMATLLDYSMAREEEDIQKGQL